MGVREWQKITGEMQTVATSVNIEGYCMDMPQMQWNVLDGAMNMVRIMMFVTLKSAICLGRGIKNDKENNTDSIFLH